MRKQSIHQGSTAGARLFLAAILVASIGPLAAALIGDLVFDLAGCTPCAYQRVPYLLAAGLAGIAILTQPSRAEFRLIIVFCALFFASSSSVAALREGVEEGWWKAPGETLLSPALASIQTALSFGLIRSTCDQLAIPVSAVSLTMLNFAYAGALSFLCIVVAVISDNGSGVLWSERDRH